MTAALVAAPPATEEATPAERRPGTPTPVRLALGGVVSIAFVFNCWALSRNGLGNTYYSAATRSMVVSWRNFFFASFDPGGFITVDKPPVALWFEAMSVRMFGYSSWSLLLPSALAGTASVALLFTIVRRHFGAVAATIAALVLAVSPVSVSVNRLNLPEPFMILFLVAAAWAVLRSLDAARPFVWLAVAGGFAGLAFNTKTLAAAIAFPALGLAVLFGSPTWRTRIVRGAVLAGVAAAASLCWVLAVDAIPSTMRPYVGGSKDNTELNLLIGYNGLGRVDGDGQLASGGRLGGVGGAGGVFGGQPGKLRLLSDAVGSQIGWLLPLAAGATVLSIWTYRKRRHRLAAVVLWSTWFWLYAIVFSEAKGIFHSYYTSVLAPAVGALVGIGTVAALRSVRKYPTAAFAVAAVVGLTVAVQRLITNRAPHFHAWAAPAMEVIVAIGLVALFVTAFVPKVRRWAGLSLLVVIGGFLIAPMAWAWSETTSPVLNATLPQAGPRIGVSGSTFGSAAFDPDATLAEFLRTESGGARWDLATTSAMTASGLIAEDDLSVMAMGGFLGSDPATSVAKVADEVKKGELRFFLSGGGFGPRFGAAIGGAGGFGSFPPNSSLQGSPNPPGPTAPRPAQARPPAAQVNPPAGPPAGIRGGFGGGPRVLARLNEASAVMAAVEQVCEPLTYTNTGGRLSNEYDGRLFDCRGHGDELAALG